MKLLDGYKRVIMLTVFIGAAISQKVFGVDVFAHVSTVFAVLGWDPTTAPVDPTLVVAAVGGVYAIVDGLKKAIAEAKANTK